MTPLAIRAKKARRSKGRCPYCRTTMTVGQMIALLPRVGWVHSRCASAQLPPRCDVWAAQLGLTRSRQTPCPCTLTGRRCCAYGRGLSGFSGVPDRECRELCDPHGLVREWDHDSLWNRRGRPLVGVTQLYSQEVAKRVAGRFAGRLEDSLFTVVLASADGPHSSFSPGVYTPVLLVAKRHRDARDTVRDLLRLDPQAQVITTGGCS